MSPVDTLSKESLSDTTPRTESTDAGQAHQPKQLDRIEVRHITPEECGRRVTQRILLSMLMEVLPDKQVNQEVLGRLAKDLTSGAMRAYWLIAPNGQKAGVFCAQVYGAGTQQVFYISAMLFAKHLSPEAWRVAFDEYLKPHAKSLGCTHVQFDSEAGNKGTVAIAKSIGAEMALRFTVEL